MTVNRTTWIRQEELLIFKLNLSFSDSNLGIPTLANFFSSSITLHRLLVGQILGDLTSHLALFEVFFQMSHLQRQHFFLAPVSLEPNYEEVIKTVLCA